eukprot:scaffold11360_cov114-Isochrysis_galbana.AAC.9
MPASNHAPPRGQHDGVKVGRAGRVPGRVPGRVHAGRVPGRVPGHVPKRVPPGGIPPGREPVADAPPGGAAGLHEVEPVDGAAQDDARPGRRGLLQQPLHECRQAIR